jgi:hypothetical protein
MAELRLTLDLRLPPDPAVIAPVWAAAGIKHSTPEICRMLLLAQLAAPLDETGWHGAALIVGAALEAVAPEREAEAGPAESAAYAEMAAAYARPLPLGGATQSEARSADPEPEPILIEDDDAPTERGVPSEPEPAAEADWLALIDRVEAGESIASVARSAGVDGRALGGKVTARRRLLKPAGPGAEAIPPAETAPAAAETGAPAEVPAEPPAQVEPEAEDEGEPTGGLIWTPRRDLQLVVAMTSGQGALHASRKMGLGREDCVKRFKELLPRPGALAQQALIKRLRARIAAEGGEVEP